MGIDKRSGRKGLVEKSFSNITLKIKVKTEGALSIKVLSI